jgi:hypothetical protein
MEDRVVMGPFFNRGGFQAWFFVCFEDVIVAIPQGFWYAIKSAATGGAMMHFGAIGGLVQGLADASTKAHEDKRVTKLRKESKADLLGATGNVVYPVPDIASIQVKLAIGSPEVIITPKGKKRCVYGVTKPADFDGAKKVLTTLYPNLIEKKGATQPAT